MVHSAAAGSIARTAGLGVAEVESVLDGLARCWLVERLPTGWRLADGADQG